MSVLNSWCNEVVSIFSQCYGLIKGKYFKITLQTAPNSLLVENCIH